MSDDEQRKDTVEIGSGDFQNNPIYGDAPQSMGSTYVDDTNPAAQADTYNYPPAQNNQYGGDEDDDANNPFQESAAQQPPPQNEYNEQAAGNGYQQNEYQQQNAPPAYQQEPPAAPPAYADGSNQQNDYNDEPEDVVAQMNQNQMPADDDVDYGVTQPKVDDTTGDDSENGTGFFGNFFIRTVWMASSILFASMLSFGLFGQKTPSSDFKTGFGLSLFAALLLFFGSIAALVYAILTKLGRPIPGEKIVLWVIIGLYMAGGLFYFFGGCAHAYAWNAKPLEASYIAGIFFAEQSFVAFHGILAGLDLFRRKFLNNKKIRVLVYNVLFFFLSLVCFFAYAVTSTTFDDIGADNAGPAWLALWYFVVMIPEVLFVIIFLIPVLSEKLGKPIILFIIAVVYAIAVLCILIGYFIVTGQFVGLKGRAYFLGVGFFVLATGVMIAFDMVFDRFIPGYKDGGNSLSDVEARGGAVPTDNADSPRENDGLATTEY